jgi:NAD(P)-dependent dehydrogenase (short-subunit alcohol dehydrogenase family)
VITGPAHVTGKAQVPLERLGESEEIARAVSFLTFVEVSFINGQDIVIDRGTSRFRGPITARPTPVPPGLSRWP